ncbi:MAG: hypothetical protein ABI797_02630 [Chloroflexota bacterium]
MTRRPLGRGRTLIALGALLVLAGMLPAWWHLAQTNRDALSGNGLEGGGIVIFLAALALLALIVLPYATRDGDSALDRPAGYVLLSLFAIAAFLFRVYEISGFASLELPMSSPGLWLTGAGVVVVVWGVADILTERPPAY